MIFQSKGSLSISRVHSPKKYCTFLIPYESYGPRIWKSAPVFGWNYAHDSWKMTFDLPKGIRIRGKSRISVNTKLSKSEFPHMIRFSERTESNDHVLHSFAPFSISLKTYLTYDCSRFEGFPGGSKLDGHFEWIKNDSLYWSEGRDSFQTRINQFQGQRSDIV